MKRKYLILGAVVVVGLFTALRCAAFSLLPFFFSLSPPIYTFGSELPSPDGRYVAVVLRGDKSAIDDFFYRVYVFPHAEMPKAMKEGEQVAMAGIWADKKFLVYVGYDTPELRWKASRSLVISAEDLYPEINEFHPIKNITGGNDVILTSLELTQQGP